MVQVTFEDDIAIINLGNTENRLNIPFCKALHNALDKVLANEDIAALICTASGKFFSNGLDLQSDNFLETVFDFWPVYNSVLLRILCFPMPTICAINGHAFAGGCFLSLAFDYRVMNSDKGWISANEVYMPSRLPEFLMYFIREKLPSSTQRIEILAMGKRFVAAEAQKEGIVHATAPGKELINKAKEIARERLQLGPLPRRGCEDIKRDLYRDLTKRYMDSDFMQRDEIPRPKL